LGVRDLGVSRLGVSVLGVNALSLPLELGLVELTLLGVRDMRDSVLGVSVWELAILGVSGSYVHYILFSMTRVAA
jgi:hypothetical protein